jgi:Lar family restriction alleviation protein
MKKSKKETQMSDLKPCPFCGGNEVKLYIDDGLGVFSYYYEIVCRHCGLSNKSIYANRDRVENAAIKHWNTRPIEDALRKEIAQLKKDKLELNAQCFHKDETILVLKNRITELEFDNRSLVEQMNKMVCKPNQEIIEWHQHPLYPDTSRCCIVECTDNCFYVARHSDIDGWLHSVTYRQLLNVKSWAYLPKGVINEHKTN